MRILTHHAHLTLLGLRWRARNTHLFSLNIHLSHLFFQFRALLLLLNHNILFFLDHSTMQWSLWGALKSGILLDPCAHIWRPAPCCIDPSILIAVNVSDDSVLRSKGLSSWAAILIVPFYLPTLIWIEVKEVIDLVPSAVVIGITILPHLIAPLRYLDHLLCNPVILYRRRHHFLFFLLFLILALVFFSLIVVNPPDFAIELRAKLGILSHLLQYLYHQRVVNESCNYICADSRQKFSNFISTRGNFIRHTWYLNALLIQNDLGPLEFCLQGIQLLFHSVHLLRYRIIVNVDSFNDSINLGVKNLIDCPLSFFNVLRLTHVGNRAIIGYDSNLSFSLNLAPWI